MMASNLNNFIDQSDTQKRQMISRAYLMYVGQGLEIRLTTPCLTQLDF